MFLLIKVFSLFLSPWGLKKNQNTEENPWAFLRGNWTFGEILGKTSSGVFPAAIFYFVFPPWGGNGVALGGC